LVEAEDKIEEGTRNLNPLLVPAAIANLEEIAANEIYDIMLDHEEFMDFYKNVFTPAFKTAQR
jgi:hypothetical protein